MPEATFPIAADADDGNGFKSGATYPPSGSYTVSDGSNVSARKSFISGTTYFIECGYLRFDTSTLPDGATITSAVLRIWPTVVTNTDSRSLLGDYYDFGGEPSVTGDWQETSSGGAFTVSISTLSAASWNEITLLNPAANINKTGYTGIRLGISGGTPTGENLVTPVSSENATWPNNQCELVVTYSEGSGGGVGSLGAALPPRLPFSTGGNTYYVNSSTGSDSRTATEAQNPSTPWATITKAINTVPLAGSIILCEGTFNSGPNFSSFALEWRKAGSPSNPVTIKANGAGCTIGNSNSAAGPAYGAWIVGGTGLRIEGITFNVRGNGGAGVLIEQGAQWIEIYRCRFIETGGGGGNSRGINAGNGGGDSTDIRWEACEFGPSDAEPLVFDGFADRACGVDLTATYYSTQGTHWLYLGGESGDDQQNNIRSGTEREVVANCIFYGSCPGNHLQAGPQFRNGFIVNNTFYYNRCNGGNVCSYPASGHCEWYAGNGVRMWDEGGTFRTNDVVVANNLFVEHFGRSVGGSTSGTGGVTTRYVFNNIGWLSSGGAGHDGGSSSDYFWEFYGDTGRRLYFETKPDGSAAPNMQANPLLDSPTTRDFGVTGGSPALSASLLDWTPTHSFDGSARSPTAPTIGAIETATTAHTITKAGAIASAEAFGTPRIARLRLVGIASAEAFGTPQLVRLGGITQVRADGIASAEAFGGHHVVGPVPLTPAGGEPAGVEMRDDEVATAWPRDDDLYEVTSELAEEPLYRVSTRTT